MRALLVVALGFALSGCVQVDVGDGEGDTEGGSSSTSQFCVNGVCRTCIDGECSGPLQEFENEAAKQHPDANIQESRDLMEDGDKTWTFWVEPEATGHVVVRLVDPVAGEVGVDNTACVRWEQQTPGGGSSGSTGNCSSGANIAISGPGVGDGTLLSWDAFSPGRYTIAVTAPPQPTQLVVDIVVDNP